MNRNDIDWHGSFAVIITPFTRDGAIDEAGYRGVIDLVLEAGCHGVITAGSTGEFFLMTADERKRVFEICVDQVKGRIPVIAGPSATRTEDVIDFTRHARKVGCDGVMALPPIYIGIDDREVKEWYRRIAGEGELPVMLYNSPTAVKNFLTPALIEELVKIDEVVAIKDSSFDILQFSDLVRTVGDEIRLFIGLEHMLVPALAIGGDGAVAMTPPICGRMATELYESYVRGDHETAKALHVKMHRLYDIFTIGDMYIGIKEAMNMMGKPGGHSRPPMLPYTDEQRAQLRVVLEELGLMEAREAAE